MRKALKITVYIICSILLLLLGAIIYLDSPWGQNFVRGKAESYLNDKLKTEVRIGYLGYGFPKFIVIKDILLRDQARDTLLAAHELKVDLDMLKLIHKTVHVQQLVLNGVTGHIYRNLPDTAYNFTYIVNAFTGNKPPDPAKPKDTSSAAMDIAVDRVLLDNIRFRLNDQTGGMSLAITLDHLDLKMRKLDLEHMTFNIKDLSVAGLQTYYAQDTSYLPVNPHPTKAKLKLIADNADLSRIGVQYNDNLNKLLFGLKLGELQLQLNKFSLDENAIDVKKLVTKNTDIVLSMGSRTTRPAFIDTLVKIDQATGWHINAASVDLASVNFKMDDNSKPKAPLGMDYLHLDFRNTSLNMKDFLYTTDTVAGNIKHLSGEEQCGLVVKELRTEFNNNPQGATLNNLYFETPNTIVQDHLEVHYPSVSEVAAHTQLLQLKLHVVNSVIALQDLLVFAPQLHDQDIFRKYKNGRMKVEATINGRLDNMDIEHLYAAGLDNTEVLLNGRLSGLPDANKLSYNLHIARLESSAKDVAQIVPDSLLTAIRLPARFGVTGQVAGTAKDYDVSLYLASSDGLAYVRGKVATSPGKNKEKYDLAVRTSSLNIGRILKQDSLLGTVTANFVVKGQSFDPKTMTATADGNIGSAFIKGYYYHDITLYGKVAGQHGNIDLMSADPNVHVQLTGQADFGGKYMAAKADIRIDSMDFHALKLYSTELRASGTIHADFPDLNPDYPRGSFTWWKPVVVADGKRYYLDSMYIVSRPSQDTGQNIFIDLDVMQARITGKTPLTKIAPIIQEHINRHYTFPKDSTKRSLAALKAAATADSMAANGKVPVNTTLPADYDLRILAHVINKPMLRGVLPGLTSFDSVHIDAQLTPKYLSLNVLAPDIVYGTSAVTNASIKVNGTDSAFTYRVTAGKLSQGKFALWDADIHGDLDKDNITTSISLSDAGHKVRFALKADMEKAGDSQVVHLEPGLVLNYKAWEVAQPNRIVLAGGGFYISNFEISNSGQYIKANNDGLRLNTPLKIDISNFQLANVTDIASSNDTLPANGLLGGSVIIQQMTPSLKMSGDLTIAQLSVFGDTLGDLKVQVNNKEENTLDTKVTLTGQGNDIAMNGSYYLKPSGGNDFNLNLDVNALALRSFESLTFKQVRNSSGFIRGKLQVQGTATAPQVTGELHTDNLVTTISQLNATFKMPAEKMSFTKGEVAFNNFTMQDSAGNKAVVTGSVNVENLKAIQMDMHVAARNWRALHSTKKDNKIFYGDLMLTANLDIKGTPAAPSIDGTLKILKGTNVTVVNPESNPEIESHEGIVVFVNMKDTARRFALAPHKRDSVKHKMAVGSDFNVNITVDKDAQFSLVIDEASGDFLSVRGDASLNASVSAGGTISLAGTYALHSGAYQFNYNFVKRKFAIQDGSSITFSGDPVKGTNMDVTAAYEAQVAPYDLVQRQVSDPTQLNYYKQRLPFDVDLHLKGPVLSPRITFDVVLPEGKVYPLSTEQLDLVQGKLSQVRTDTSELNKQVFAILILNRFVSDDPFSSGASNSASFTALQSVSTFIGEQLNQAAGKLVKGIDFSVDLATSADYTTGDMRQRTDLNLAASKRLLNDRLKLTIGNDFELEGPQTNTNSQTSYIPTNLAADYLLTADGKYTIRGYRKAYDEGVLQGYVTETGLNFIVSLDYNLFKNVFKKKKKRPETETSLKNATTEKN